MQYVGLNNELSVWRRNLKVLTHAACGREKNKKTKPYKDCIASQ